MSRPNIPLYIAIHHVHLSTDQKEAFQQAFMGDAEMHALTDLIITSWPDDIKQVPHPLHPYWQHHETLTVEDGLVLHGEALIVHPSERERILHKLHQFHQEITKSHLLICGCIFWPGINTEEVVHQCETCTQFQVQNAATPLTPTPTPYCPRQCMPQTSLPWEEPTTSYVVTSTQRWSSSNISHLARATPPNSSHCSRKCSHSMESQNSFTLTMVLNMLVPSLLSFAPLGVSPMRPQPLTIDSQLDLQRHV